MLKKISPLLIFSMLMASEYSLPDEATVSEHFLRLKALRAEQKNKAICNTYGNPNNLPTAPLNNYNPQINRTNLPDSISIPINYHLIYVGGDSVYMNLQVDNQPYEHCMWDIWSYDNNTFLLYPGFGWDYPGHSYSLGGVLTPGNYALFIYDDFGSGGVSGNVTTSDGTVLATLNGGSYSYYTFLQFTAPEGNYTDGLLTNAQIESQTTVLNNQYNQYGYYFYTANIDSANNSGWYYATDSHKFDTGQWNNDDQYLIMAQAMGFNPSTSINFYWTGARFTSGLGVYPWSFDEDDPKHGLFCGNYTIPGGDTGLDLGHTGVHEVGHYFGLYHTFENGCANPGDEVDDTPSQSEPNYGCPSSPYSCGSYDDVGNFMDYMDDGCLNHFTQGQLDRMEWALSTYRPLLYGEITNEPPGDFTLIIPSDSSDVTITTDNLATDVATFFWGTSEDPNGDDLTYTLTLSSEEIGTHSFETSSVLYEVTYIWFAEQLGTASESETNIIWNVTVTDGQETISSSNGPLQVQIDAYGVLGNENETHHPEIFTLFPNYPNPFNPETTLHYNLHEQFHVEIMIYDLMGREIKSLVNEYQTAGIKSVVWDASNENSQQVSAGVYLYQIRAGQNIQTRKLVLLK